MKSSCAAPYLAAAIGSVLLSILRTYQSPILNNDAVVYLQQAALFLDGDWHAAWSLYKWPFYAALIAFTQQISGLSLEMAARWLDGSLWLGVTVGFVFAVHCWGGRQAPLWGATAVILVYPWINDLRPLLIREAGYLASYLFGMGWLLTLNRQFFDFKTFFLAATAFFVSGLFRVEGLLVAAAMAMVWPYRPSSPWRWINAVALAALFLGAAIFWWQETQLGNHWQRSVDGLRQLLLFEAKNYSHLAWATVLAVLLVGAIVTRLTIPYLLLAIYAHRQQLLPRDGMPYWHGLLGLQLLVLIGQLAAHGFLTRRYTLAIALTVMVAVPFAIAAIYRQRHAQPWFWRFTVGALLIFALDSAITTGASQHYRRDAGDWLATAAVGQPIASNDRPLLWYANAASLAVELPRPMTAALIPELRTKLQKNTWLALNLKPDALADAVRRELGEPQRQFANEKQQAIWIYAP